jgi:hypothetical protein
MFDKIPSFKDFILYVIPGIIYCYIALDLYNYFKGGCFTCDNVLNSTSMSFVAIIFSFLIGFLISQLVIIMIGILLDKKLKQMRTILETQKENIEVKTVLINKIKNVFGIQNVSETDDLIVFLCLNYVKIKTNEVSNTFIDRQYNMATFAMTAYLPVILVVIDLLIKFETKIWILIPICLLFSFIFYRLVRKIVINFRDDYYKNVFRQFISLT